MIWIWIGALLKDKVFVFTIIIEIFIWNTLEKRYFRSLSNFSKKNEIVIEFAILADLTQLTITIVAFYL